jgi:hypothetical protein
VLREPEWLVVELIGIVRASLSMYRPKIGAQGGPE